MEKEKGLEVTEESDWNVNVQHNGRGIKARVHLAASLEGDFSLEWSEAKQTEECC